MPAALVTLLWTSLAAMLFTAAAGLKLFGSPTALHTHVVISLTATMLLLFAHTMTMFYFIGSAKKLKEFVQGWEEGEREGVRARTVATKRKLFPWILLACFAVMGAFVLGGAYDAGLVDRPAHTYLGYAAIVLQGHVVSLETIHIFRNIELIREVTDAARRHSPRGPGPEMG